MENNQLINNLNVRQISVGILHLNLGRAMTYFPGSTKAHPSHVVTVMLTSGGPLNESFNKYFPLQIIWHLWETVVWPVIQDPDYQVMKRTGSLRNQINLQYVRDDNYEALLERIDGGLILKLQEMGYIPGESLPVGIPNEALGEESLPVGDSKTIPLVESDNDRWPEGHLRLTYPVVE